jgi:hypothetical protein
MWRLALRKSMLDGNILVLDISEVAQASKKVIPNGFVVIDGADARQADGLLRARRRRPRRSRAAKCGQEFSSSDVACHVTLRWGSFMQWRDHTTL